MAWVSTIILDTGRADVGTVNSVFSTTDADEFSYSARVQVSAAGRDAYINAAILARDEWQTRRTNEASHKSNVEARFIVLDV